MRKRWEDVEQQYTVSAGRNASILRKNQTDAEGLLWHYLRGKQLGGYKFRRQQPIGGYVADFVCMPRKLIVELDGGQHADRQIYDRERDAYLRGQGYRVLRFWNNEVMGNCYGVLEQIYGALHAPGEVSLRVRSRGAGSSDPPPERLCRSDSPSRGE